MEQQITIKDTFADVGKIAQAVSDYANLHQELSETTPYLKMCEDLGIIFAQLFIFKTRYERFLRIMEE